MPEPWQVDTAEFQGYVRAKLEAIEGRLDALHGVDRNHEKRLRILERIAWGALALASVAVVVIIPLVLRLL